MATIYWIGGVAPRACTARATVTATSGTITATINGQVETYTSPPAEAVAAAAAGAVAAFRASPIPEFGLVVWSSPSAAVILATGQADGRPVTVTYGVTGTCAVTAATAAAASPHQVGTAANYSGAAVPTSGDVLVVAGDRPAMKYGLDTFASLTVGVVLRDTYSADIGLNDANRLGFAEFLPPRLQSKGTSWTIGGNGRNSWRLQSTAVAATAVTVVGSGTRPTVEMTGLPAGQANAVSQNGGGLTLAPLDTDACHVATLAVAGRAALSAGPNLTVTTATVAAATAEFRGAVATLNVREGGEVTASLAAACTSANVHEGTLNWASTGSPGTVFIGSKGEVDFNGSPTAVTVTAVTMEDGATIVDDYKKTTGYTITADLNEVTVKLGGARVLAVS